MNFSILKKIFIVVFILFSVFPIFFYSIPYLQTEFLFPLTTPYSLVEVGLFIPAKLILGPTALISLKVAYELPYHVTAYENDVSLGVTTFGYVITFGIYILIMMLILRAILKVKYTK